MHFNAFDYFQRITGSPRYWPWKYRGTFALKMQNTRFADWNTTIHVRYFFWPGLQSRYARKLFKNAFTCMAILCPGVSTSISQPLWPFVQRLLYDQIIWIIWSKRILNKIRWSLRKISIMQVFRKLRLVIVFIIRIFPILCVCMHWELTFQFLKFILSHPKGFWLRNSFIFLSYYFFCIKLNEKCDKMSNFRSEPNGSSIRIAMKMEMLSVQCAKLLLVRLILKNTSTYWWTLQEPIWNDILLQSKLSPP